jgi:hypothetical protein
MVILHTILVAHYLAVKFVHQFVNRRVQVLMGAFCKHVAAFDMDIALCALPSLLFLLFLDGQEHFDIDNLVKVAGNAIKLGRYVTSQGWCDFEVMTADRQVHE